MVHVVPDILARIVAQKREMLGAALVQRAEFERKAADRRDHRDFKSALTARPPAVLAEIKRASPSKGVFTDAFDPASIARAYASGGAAALSVLTDREFFQGGLSDLEAARAAVPVPILRKDFTIDEIHVMEAAAHGADAILLIAALLDESQMRRFREMAAGLGMAALVEVHDQNELAAALGSGAEIVGVNNRNLHTFEVRLETSLRLAERIPASVVKVSESGIHSGRDVRKLAAAGYNAFLVGEHLMKSADAAAAIGELRS
ncbi:MAG TPA: indole-3-glycerol phosphate synthase TrpC [Bryobacteraceae bacterium]|nr:indole-3-glycerol phosphate synthase TrpC [Bryobacteraceae bacterium]